MGFRVGVDVGGSFTDFAVISDDLPTVLTMKVVSRPDDPGAEIRNGLSLLSRKHGLDPAKITYFTHGTTVGVNTVIQRNGLRLALFTTRHFEDVLELGRLKVPHIHDLFSLRPRPLIPRDLVFGIDQRMDSQGRTVQAIDDESIRQAVARAKTLGAEGILVSFLHSYRDSGHETAVKRLVGELAPDLPCFCSSEIWPIIREYERTITATISAYVQPRVAQYLDRFESTLLDLGVKPPLRITKSNGGVMGARQARSECVQMILSGTASGVIGAAYVAEVAGFDRVISLDIGGTSADAAIIVDGRPSYAFGELIGEFQIHIPSISVSSIGQGGGSIATLDDMDVLHVGPESAGSTPGPAGFGRGGARPTLTDAMAVCGFLGHSTLGYGAVTLDPSLAREAYALIAARLNLPPETVATSVIKLAVSGMYADTSALISRFGVDARQFYMMAFGGAGPMLACFLARELNLAGVLVPLRPGVLSALGGLIADLKNDFLSTIYADLEPRSAAVLSREYRVLVDRAWSWLRDEQGHRGDASVTCACEMRYKGQSFEVTTELNGAWLEAGDLETIGAAFHDEHRRLYGHADMGAAIQVISLRLTITTVGSKPKLPEIDRASGELKPDQTVRVWLNAGWRDALLVQRDALKAGHAFSGPAVVVQDDCTTVVPDGFSALVDPFGNLVLKIDQQNGSLDV